MGVSGFIFWGRGGGIGDGVLEFGEVGLLEKQRSWQLLWLFLSNNKGQYSSWIDREDYCELPSISEWIPSHHLLVHLWSHFLNCVISFPPKYWKRWFSHICPPMFFVIALHSSNSTLSSLLHLVPLTNSRTCENSIFQFHAASSKTVPVYSSG